MPPDVHTKGPHHSDAPELRPADMPSWADSLFDLVNSRIALFRLEARHAAGRGVARVIMVVAAALSVILTWLLLMAGVVGVVQAFTGFAWYWTCLGLGGVHMLAMLAFLRAARASGPPTFEHTRAEFQKDCEWFQNLQHRKSKP